MNNQNNSKVYDDRFDGVNVLTADESARRLASLNSPVTPVLLAGPDEPWRHLHSLMWTDKRRQTMGLPAVRVHHSFVKQWNQRNGFRFEREQKRQKRQAEAA